MSDRAANSQLTGSDFEPDWLNNLLDTGSKIAMTEVTRALYGKEAMQRQAVAEVKGDKPAGMAQWLAANWMTVAIVAAAVCIPGGFVLWLMFRKK